MRPKSVVKLAATAILLVISHVGCNEDVEVIKMSLAEVTEVAEINAAAESPRRDHSFQTHHTTKKKTGKKPKKPATPTIVPENEDEEDSLKGDKFGQPVAIGIDVYGNDANDENSEEAAERRKKRRRPKSTTARPTPARETEVSFDPIVSAEQLNLRELKFQPMEDKKFNKRSANYVGAFLTVANEDAPSDVVAAVVTEETAPPEIIIPPGQLVDEDDVIKQMRAARLHIHSADDYHRGGNAPTVNFEDALKVTVPYGEAKL